MLKKLRHHGGEKQFVSLIFLADRRNWNPGAIMNRGTRGCFLYTRGASIFLHMLADPQTIDSVAPVDDPVDHQQNEFAVWPNGGAWGFRWK